MAGEVGDDDQGIAFGEQGGEMDRRIDPALDRDDAFLVAEQAVGHDDRQAGRSRGEALAVGMGDMPDGVAPIAFVQGRGLGEKRHPAPAPDSFSEHLQVERTDVSQLFRFAEMGLDGGDILVGNAVEQVFRLDQSVEPAAQRSIRFVSGCLDQLYLFTHTIPYWGW